MPLESICGCGEVELMLKYFPMKTSYFSSDSIEAKSRQMLSKVQDLRDRHLWSYNPARSALLVLDMQRFFLEHESHAYIPSARAVVPNILSLVDAYRAANLPVIFTRHINTPQDAGMMAKWWRDIITSPDPLSDLAADFDKSADVLLDKHQYDAFHGTQLDEMLKDRSVTQVVISGVMTHLCCETTARAAYMYGYEVFFTIDGTATYNEAFHSASLLNLAHGFATPALVSEILAALGAQGGD